MNADDVYAGQVVTAICAIGKSGNTEEFSGMT